MQLKWLAKTLEIYISKSRVASENYSADQTAQ